MVRTRVNGRGGVEAELMNFIFGIEAGMVLALIMYGYGHATRR